MTTSNATECCLPPVSSILRGHWSWSLGRVTYSWWSWCSSSLMIITWQWRCIRPKVAFWHVHSIRKQASRRIQKGTQPDMSDKSHLSCTLEQYSYPGYGHHNGHRYAWPASNKVKRELGPHKQPSFVNNITKPSEHSYPNHLLSSKTGSIIRDNVGVYV